jgi:hypothetical protein
MRRENREAAGESVSRYQEITSPIKARLIASLFISCFIALKVID